MHLGKTLSAYIARHFFLWFCGVFGTMAVVTFLADYIELIRRGGSKVQATLSLLFEMAALQSPQTAQDVLPFAVLFGTMLAFWRLTRNNELVIVRAAGVSVWQFLMPAALVALLIGVIAVTIFNPIASRAAAAFAKLDAQVLGGGGPSETVLSSAGFWLRQSDRTGDQIIIHGGKFASPDRLLDSVSIFFFDDHTRFTSRIDARAARLETGNWLIEDGVRWRPDKPPETFTQWQLPTQLTPHKIEQSFASPETMSFWDLPGFIELLERSGFPAQRHRLHYDVLLARPFLLCSMVLIAAIFSLRMQRRGGTTLMIVGGVASGFILFVVSNIVFALGISDKVPVALAAWTPTGVSLIFGISTLLHLEDG
jgi:lipopolysaccharide export system permease protein